VRINENVVRINSLRLLRPNSPHAQLHWIFGQIEAEQDNLKTAAQYSYAKNKYFEFPD
jgi:hypothetical protein